MNRITSADTHGLKSREEIDNMNHRLMRNNMNRITSADTIKVLAVTILDEQKCEDFFAAQDGSSLIRIRLNNSIFPKIPYQAVFYAQGLINYSLSTDDVLSIDIDLQNEGHRFISFKHNSLNFDKTFTLKDHLQSLQTIPELSDCKDMPHEHEFGSMDFSELKKHAHYVKIIRDELECGDFDVKPPYIKGAAYEKMYDNYKKRVQILDAKFGTINHNLLETESKPMKARTQKTDNQRIKKQNKPTV